MDLRLVDPTDPVALGAWHAAYLAADTYGREYAVPWAIGELHAEYAAVDRSHWRQAWSGVVDGEVVAAGTIVVPLLDNLASASVQVYTRPELRRRGYGSAMLRHLEGIGRERGRRIFDAEVAWPLASGDGAGEPGVVFASGHGYALGLVDLQQQLDLPVPEATLQSLAAEVAPHHAAYRLRSWVGPVPDDLAPGVADLAASLVVEAPVGELHLEAETAEVGLLRDGEAILARQGRTKYNTVALDSAGAVAAYTDLVTSEHEDGRAFQWGTLVRRADRGHRLGLAMKVANLALLQRHRPDLTCLRTFNAEDNGPMLAVNQRLGYRPVERLGEFQKRE